MNIVMAAEPCAPDVPPAPSPVPVHVHGDRRPVPGPRAHRRPPAGEDAQMSPHTPYTDTGRTILVISIDTVKSMFSEELFIFLCGRYW